MDYSRLDLVRAWIATAVAGLLALGGGSLLAPGIVYDRFVWQYFWGPVVADAHDAQCAIRSGGDVVTHTTASACTAGADAVLARPGYTIVSEVGYAIVGIFALLGVLAVLRRLQIGTDRRFVGALVPMMLFGGFLRTIEDANDAVITATDGAGAWIAYPLNTILISPVIYVTVFVVALAGIVVCLWLERHDYVERYTTPLAAYGAAALAISLIVLAWGVLVRPEIGFYPQVPILTLGLATAIAVGIHYALDRWWPVVTAGTGLAGLAVLWGQAVDGVANVINGDWASALGLPVTYTPKHPANRIIIDVTQAIFPADVVAIIGTSWPFLLVKLAVAIVVLWLFNEEFMDESPRFGVLLLIAIVAVGLGPGTRDMARATIGI
ncbi:DUF63 family protein [Halococcoides cellulosivorans]|uniref:DUF63 family protein n=1 Tax=Halococcoides cellulosivorans TaxID=1679096 RepID=A0A2R4X1F9_9EURY|nr:DUF63 family protein [Halococcoides cellulosivorans]AWB27619.1 hypothetical protein HARCEL1_07805 [Halococcoides cellulosivorans]